MVTRVLPESLRGVRGTQWRGFWRHFSSPGRTGIEKEGTNCVSYFSSKLTWDSSLMSLLSQQGDFSFIRKREGRASKRARDTETGRQKDRRWTVKLLGYGGKEQLQGGGARSDMTRAPTGLASLLL